MRLNKPTDLLCIEIHKEDVEAKNVKAILEKLTRLSEDKETIKHFFEKVEILVLGYELDERPVWDIPEVREFIQNIDKDFPYWFYFLYKYSNDLKMLTYCIVNADKTYFFYADPLLNEFMHSHFVALEELYDKANLNESEIKKLEESVINYFYSPKSSFRL